MKKHFPPVVVPSGLSFQEQQYIETTDKKKSIWFVSRICDLARNLPVFDLPLVGINTWGLEPKIENWNDWISHVNKVMNANLSHPIILSGNGEVMDGRHRIAKAILYGKKTIKAVRFNVTPDCDFYVDL
ncbi:MAG: chromosome partitioning protein ParB [Magnetococcales bacterium]|nr:chromosome partitioning protein ParB [Magnetococcales bacterium]